MVELLVFLTDSGKAALIYTVVKYIQNVKKTVDIQKCINVVIHVAEIQENILINNLIHYSTEDYLKILQTTQLPTCFGYYLMPHN